MTKTTAPEPQLRLSRRRWRWRRSRARRRWPSWRSSSTCIPIRSRNGRPASGRRSRRLRIGGEGRRQRAPAVDVKTLHAKIGELALENDFLAGALSKAGLLSAKR